MLALAQPDRSSPPFSSGGGIVYVELILGELVPKALALRFTDTVALLVAPPLDFLSRASRWAGRAS